MAEQRPFGMQLRRLRTARGLSLADLARLVHYSKGHLSRVETGAKPPSPDLADRCDKVLDAGGQLRSIVIERGAADSSGAGPRSRSTPAPVPGFVGRQAEMAQLTDALRSDGPRMVVLCGAPGVGKSALARQWLATSFTGPAPVVLIIDLRGYGLVAPLTAPDAAAHLLAELEVDPQLIPVGAEAVLACFRKTIARQAMVLVLDDARSAEQVRPLISNLPNHFTVVTSRHRLSGLVATHAARWLRLSMLDEDEALQLLTTIAPQASLDSGALADLAAACAGLPLALRIAAARLVTSPQLRADDLAELIRGRAGLNTLTISGDIAVRAAFDLSYAALPPPARHVLSALGLRPVVDLTAQAAAAICDVPVSEAAAALDLLADSHLITEHARGRFVCHELVRSYARDYHAEAPTLSYANARSRLLGWYFTMASAAATLLYPQLTRLDPPDRWVGAEPRLDDRGTASRWLDAEIENLTVAIHDAAADRPADPAAWLLADALRGWFYHHRRTTTWIRAATAALTAAAAADDQKAVAAMHASLAQAAQCAGRFDDSVAAYERAYRHACAADWLDGQATAVGNLGAIHYWRGDLDRAAELYATALDINQRAGNQAGVAVRLGNLGGVHRLRGRLAEAEQAYTEAATTYRQIGSLDGQALMHVNLGTLALQRADPVAAYEHAITALDLYEQAPSVPGGCLARNLLARVHTTLGDPARAIEHATRALSASRAAEDPCLQVDALNALAAAHSRLGQEREAHDCAQAAAELARSVGYDEGVHDAAAILRVSTA